MDLRASNCILEQLEGDVKTLTGAAVFQKIVMEDDDTLLLSGDDLTAALHSICSGSQKPLQSTWSSESRSGSPFSLLGPQEPLLLAFVYCQWDGQVRWL